MLAGMSSSPVPYPLRMPEELRERLKEQARVHNHSLHAEIISILQSATGNPSIAVPLDVDALANAIADRVAVKLREGSV